MSNKKWMRRHLTVETLDPRRLMAADVALAVPSNIGLIAAANESATSAQVSPATVENIDPNDHVPMPLPNPDSQIPGERARPAGALEVFDIGTRKVTRHDSLPSEPAKTSDRVPGAEGIRERSPIPEPGAPDFFTELSYIADPSAYPHSANVKEFFTFPNGQQYVCSGTMIDAMHVLTAGHCVYHASYGGWATSMRVVPGYDAGNQPFGDAMATQLISWSGWTQNSSYDHDIGIIRLDRPVGALSGWYGYLYDDNPYFYTLNIFHNSSYPADSPYNGEDMYYRNGFFDYTDTYLGIWIGNQVGIYNRSYPGQSGSSAYDLDDGSRYAYAVLSNGNSERTNFPRITSGKFDTIRNDIIAAATPSTVDLIPLDVQVDSSTVSAGSALSSLSLVVHNYSSARYNGRVDFGVYLSTDEDITTSDQLIQGYYFSYDFAPKSSVILSAGTTPTIPANVASGEYWVGVIVDFADYSVANNDTDGQDAARITVEGSSTLAGDFNGDGLYNIADIDALVTAIAVGTNNTQYDLNGDGLVNLADRDAWLGIAGAINLGPGRAYRPADGNLDGAVDGSDFGIWNANKFTNVALWSKADFDANGAVDGSDFGVWNGNKFTASDDLMRQPPPPMVVQTSRLPLWTQRHRPDHRRDVLARDAVMKLFGESQRERSSIRRPVAATEWEMG